MAINLNDFKNLFQIIFSVNVATSFLLSLIARKKHIDIIRLAKSGKVGYGNHNAATLTKKCCVIKSFKNQTPIKIFNYFYTATSICTINETWKHNS